MRSRPSIARSGTFGTSRSTSDPRSSTTSGSSLPAAGSSAARHGRSAIAPRFDAGRIPGPLPVEVEAACFRILQEALTNVARHAHAGRVTVTLVQRDQELVLSVGDDGVGFDARRLRHRRRGPSLGLVGITERVALVGGSVDVASRVGSGTMLIARFPIGPAR